MPPVDVRVPLYVGPAATITNDGNISVYYQVETNGGTTISATINDGTVDPLNSLVTVAPTFFLAAAPGAQVDIEFPQPVVNYANGLVVNGQPTAAELFAQITGSVGDDVSAIGAGTGARLSVETTTNGSVGGTSGTIQLDLGTSTSVFFGKTTLTGNVTFTVVNAEVNNMWVMGISAATHTITWPSGTKWPSGAPSPSGGLDKYTFLVVAQTSGVPTEIWGSFEQGEA